MQLNGVLKQACSSLANDPGASLRAIYMEATFTSTQTFPLEGEGRVGVEVTYEKGEQP